MDVILDANVVKYYFEFDILGKKDCSWSGCPGKMMSRIVKIFINDLIESECKENLPNDYYELWYSKMVQEKGLTRKGDILLSQLDNQLLLSVLGKKMTRDKKYIKLSFSIEEKPLIISEDLDLHDPPKKKIYTGKNRIEAILTNSEFKSSIKRKLKVEVIGIGSLQ